jgi:hypothetical protein
VEEVDYTIANMQMKTPRCKTRAQHFAHTRHAIYKTPTLNSVEVVTRFKIFTAVMNIQEVMVYEVSTDIL